MAGLIVTKKQLVMLIKKHGGKASVSDSNATLMRKANALGLGAKKAKPQYLGGRAAPSPARKKAAAKWRKRKRENEAAIMAAHRAGRLTQSQAMKKMGLDPQFTPDRVYFEKMECSRNPGPDPYRKDMLILDPAGISYTGPFGPFGQYDPQRMRNPGLPSPGQVVGGGMGDFVQMNPSGDDTLRGLARRAKAGDREAADRLAVERRRRGVAQKLPEALRHDNVDTVIETLPLGTPFPLGSPESKDQRRAVERELMAAAPEAYRNEDGVPLSRVWKHLSAWAQGVIIAAHNEEYRLARQYAEERILGHTQRSNPGRDEAIKAAWREWQAGDDLSLERLMGERVRAGMGPVPWPPGYREMHDAALAAGWKPGAEESFQAVANQAGQITRYRQIVGDKPEKRFTLKQAQAALLAWFKQRGWKGDFRATFDPGRGVGGRKGHHLVVISPDEQRRATFLNSTIVFEKGGRGNWEKDYAFHEYGLPLSIIDAAWRIMQKKEGKPLTREEWTDPMQNPPDKDGIANNPPMGDYLLESEIAPYEARGGLNDYMLLDMTPPAPRKNPSSPRACSCGSTSTKGAYCADCGTRLRKRVKIKKVRGGCKVCGHAKGPGGYCPGCGWVR